MARYETPAAGRNTRSTLKARRRIQSRERNLRSESEALAFPVAIAKAVYRVDGVEFGVDSAELLPEPFHVAIDGALADVGVVRVALLHETTAGLDVARAARERLEQQKLGHRQRQELALPRGLITCEIQLELSERELLLRLLARFLEEREATEHHFDPREELSHRERLYQVVVTPELEPEHAIELLVPGGQEDDREDFGEPPDLPAQLEPVHARHHDVQDQDVGKPVGELLPGRLAVGIEVHAVSLPLQSVAHRLADVLLVVDDGHPSRGSGAHEWMLTI